MPRAGDLVRCGGDLGQPAVGRPQRQFVRRKKKINGDGGEDRRRKRCGVGRRPERTILHDIAAILVGRRGGWVVVIGGALEQVADTGGLEVAVQGRGQPEGEHDGSNDATQELHGRE